MRRTPMRGIAAAAILAMSLGSAACGAEADGRSAPRAPLPAGACPQATATPALTTLDWESARQQRVPDTPPPGWAAELAPTQRDPEDGRPQVAIARAPDPVRAGGASGRFELRRDDPAVNGGTRAELATAPEPRGAERWYAFSIYLPPEWARDRSAEILVQWHQHASIAGNPPLAVATYRGQWEILAAGDGSGDGEQALIGAYRTGRWTDWLVQVKWSAGADGVVRIWQDGRAVPGFTDRRGPNTYPGEYGVYLKAGIYKWDWSRGKPTDTVRRVMYLDELRIAATRAGVQLPAAAVPAYYRPGSPASAAPEASGPATREGSAEASGRPAAARP